MLRIVGITGFKGSGKDVLAQPLLDAGYLRLKFAGPLKNMLRSLLFDQGASPEIVERMVEGDLKETASEYLDNLSPRWAMQSLGTEWGRECIGKDFWMNVAARSLDALSNKGDVKGVVFTDVRFPNERDFLYHRSGLLFRVNRLAVTPDDFNRLHPSEKFVPHLRVHCDVHNNGTLEDFQKAAPKHFERFGLL